MTQLDLFGFTVPYTCKKCGRSFQTMQESSRHHATKHRIKTKTKTSINFILENYQMVSKVLTVESS